MKLDIPRIFSLLFLSLFFICAADAQTDKNSKQNEKKVEKQETNRPLEIINKPHPSLTDCGQDEAAVVLKVTFDKSSKVTAVEIVSLSGCEFFDKSAIRAAKKITFKPQIENGEAVTITKVVNYKARRH